jgi:hypothetical protein
LHLSPLKPPTQREEIARLKVSLRLIATLMDISRKVEVERPAIMVTYAAFGLHFPASAPKTPAQLMCCINVLEAQPWMRRKAFEFLSRLADSDWPYLIAQWHRLEPQAIEELNWVADPDLYAPKTHAMLQAITAHRCTKPHCSHPRELHVAPPRGKGEYGRCTVDGCNCEFFKEHELGGAQ